MLKFRCPNKISCIMLLNFLNGSKSAAINYSKAQRGKAQALSTFNK